MKPVFTCGIDFQNHDPALTGFQFLEDLSTAYWYSQVLFTALELELFGFLERDSCSADDLAMAADCRPHELAWLLKALAVMGLVACDQGKFHNT